MEPRPSELPPSSTVGIWLVEAPRDAAVLKVIAHREGDPVWPASADPRHPYYWRREALAYESGIVAAFRAPALRALVDRPDGSVALWLEAVPEVVAWTPERLGHAAELLGAAQASPVDDRPWLARNWLRSYLELHDVRGATPVLERLESLPQTLSHNDLHPGNVLGEDASTFIDWAYCGLAAPGLDAGVLAADGIADGVYPADDGDAYLGAVWDGYLRGLDGAFDEDDVRFAFAHGTALRFSWRPRGENAAWDAAVALLDRLASSS